MRHSILLLISMMFIIGNVKAQVLDEETGFIYVKAEYLFETGRYEDAITQYNIVVAKDPKYKDALIHRGMSKYALTGYKGAKLDALQYIELKGITGGSAALLGRCFAGMNDLKAAANSLTAAIALEDKNPDFYEWRAQVYENDRMLIKACQDYEKAMNLGSTSAEMKARSLCGTTKPKNNQPKPNTETTDSGSNTGSTPDNNNTQTGHTPPTNPNDINEDEVLSSGTKNNDTPSNNNPGTGNTNPQTSDSTAIDDSEPKIVDDGLPKEDNTVNSFVIDEDLTIEIAGQELGKRKINEIPSILILADENGKVTVNICVNKDGVVTKAEFNATMSTIAKKSLVSLAIRKAKEFEFARGIYDIQCGTMVFKIKGS